MTARMVLSCMLLIPNGVEAVTGWSMNGKTSDDSEPFDIMLEQVIKAELTDIHFKPEEIVF